MSNMIGSTLTTEILQQRILASYSELHNWRKVAAEYKVSVGCVYHVAIEGHEPKSVKNRLALGLPAYASVPVCVNCGVVHVGKCPQAKKPRIPILREADVQDWLNREEL